MCRSVRFSEARQQDPVKTARNVKLLNALKSAEPPVAMLNSCSASTSPPATDADIVPPPPNHYLFPPESMKAMLDWKGIRGTGPGLYNLGNTCFMNSVRLCAFAAVATPPLPPLWRCRCFNASLTRRLWLTSASTAVTRGCARHTRPDCSGLCTAP